ncbi:MAG: YhbY family RNA-binding protein [Candidatus Woesearchaeota archaeon]
MITSQDKKELRRASETLKPQFFIGKNGITPEFIQELKIYFEKYELAKIKSHAATNSDSLTQQAQELAMRINAQIVTKKGFVFTLYKERED